MAAGMKIIRTQHKHQKATYFVYSGLQIRMDPSVTALISKAEDSSAPSPVDCSSSSTSASNSAYIPASVLGLRGMSDESINELLLDKLKTCSSKPNDNIEVLRAASARLHSRAGSQDKDIRENTLGLLRRKKSEALEVLLNILENVRDHVTAASVAGTIRECIVPKSDKKEARKLKNKTCPELKKMRQFKGAGRVSTIKRLVELNATQSLVKMVILLHNREIPQTDMLLQEILWILGQLSQKDSRFSIKTRLLNGVKVFHYLLRCHYFNHNKMLTPLLLIFKSLARNGTTIQILVKDGITTTLEKTLAALGFSPNTKLRLLLNVFCYLTRNGKFCSRMVKVGLVPQLLKLFERWERYDGKMRLRICYYTLQTLQHLCCSKAGRAAISGGNGLSLLHKFCQNCPDDAQHDPLLTKTCSIINACIERKELPIASSCSPAHFPLSLTNGINSIVKIGSTDTDESGEDSVDEELEEEEDEKLEKDRIVIEEPPSISSYSFHQCPQRDLDDLYMYNTFWSEVLMGSPKIADAQSILSCNGSLKGSVDSKVSFHSVNVTNSFSSLEIKDNRRSISSLSNLKVGNVKVFQDLSRKDSVKTAYCKIASKVQSVIPFVKVAYPDMMDCLKVDAPDPLFSRDRKAFRTKLLSALEKNIYPEHCTINNVVYDVDQLVMTPQEGKIELSNWDEERIGLLEQNSTTLQFESRFESGNLRKAIQVGPREYDLIMMPDVNSCVHHNWFYFEVSNMDNALPYTLNIINCDKPNSQFNFGMRPLLYSVKEATFNRPRWVRTGEDICYYKNAYTCPGKSKKKKSFQTLSFSISFPHNLDVCYIAYHFPYTYSKLLLNLWVWSHSVSPHQAYIRIENLCNTLNNNETPLLTISAPEDSNTKFSERGVIFLTSRVHPGETNSSWVMHGSLDFLLSNTSAANKLRSKYIIKIVPMLNPEGVINGCYRCGLSNEDLNRKWRDPDRVLHSSIFHTKGLIDYSCRVLKKVPYVFCDYHGHSRRKNVFLFGCSPSPSQWNQSDEDKESSLKEYILLPTLLSSIAPAFDLSQCSFVMEQSKESTARITVWREFGVTRSYTMESSYCGFDVGIYKGNHMNITHLEEMGATFCLALVYLSDDIKWIKHNTDIENFMSASNVRYATSTEPRLEDFDETSDSEGSDNEIIKA